MYEGKPVAFRLMLDGKQFIYNRKKVKKNPDICPLCRKPFIEETITSVILIISNQVGIPNRFVHSECMANLTEEYALHCIANDYQEALKYYHWFDYEQ
jgi:hypothetical protein